MESLRLCAGLLLLDSSEEGSLVLTKESGEFGRVSPEEGRRRDASFGLAWAADCIDDCEIDKT